MTARGHCHLVLRITQGAFAILPPSFSITGMVRRARKTDRSGWGFWISAIPAIGGIVLLKSTLSTAALTTIQYGPSRKEHHDVTGGAATRTA